jgi:hypothetical protein
MNSIKQEDFSYRNIINNDKKKVKIKSIKPFKKFDGQRKLPSVWYGIKHQWVEFTDINKSNKNKILELKKVNDFVKFTNTKIKYNDVMKDYNGIKNPNTIYIYIIGYLLILKKIILK